MHPQATVDRALQLSAQGLIDREVARLTGVSIGAVQKWRTGRRRARGNRRTQTSADCPRCHERPLDEPEYAYLLGLYLGDGWLTCSRKGVFAVSIACCDAWPGLAEATKTAMSAVMPISSVFTVQRPGYTEVKSTSKHWLCLFPQHGPGKKHNRKIGLAEWQRAIVDEHPGDFARGLFHSDGWRGVNRVRARLADGDRWYEYPRYLFINKSQDILLLCGQTLDRLEVAWRFSRRNAISVARRDAVARLDEFVGPKY
ncbi:MAG: transcriptional regulator [Streptosporangiaceae bacterium]|nr:transcriptional regulator [Streptosporangiaceae bacterium]